MSEIIAEFTVDAAVLEQYVETLTPLVDEAKIHVNDDGLAARVVDPANVGMYCPVTLSADAFESYDAPGAATIGVSLTTLAERIGAANAGDLVHLAVDMETRHLQIQYRNIDHHMALIDPDSIRGEPDRTELDLPNSITLTGAALDEAITAVDMVSDHIELVGAPGDKEVRFVGEGDIDNTTVTFGREEVADADVTEGAASLFSLEYFEELADPIPKDAEVTLQFGEEFPVIWDWEASEGFQQSHAMLAPRIRSD